MQEINDEQTNTENEDITTRDDKLTQLAKTVHNSETLCNFNKKSATKSRSSSVNDDGSSNVILDLTPAPVVVTESKTSSTNNDKKQQTKLSSNKTKQQKSSPGASKQNITRGKQSSSVGKMKIAGKTVDFNSEKAQYLHLTLDQIQELAFKQRGGGDTADTAADNITNDGHDEQHLDSQCPLHSKQSSTKSDSTKFATLPRLKRTKKDSPDLVKEAEASKNAQNDEQTRKMTTNKKAAVARSKSFSSRCANDSKSKMTADAAQITKKGDYRCSRGGGLFAPTKSWLSKLSDISLAHRETADRSGSSVKRSQSINRTRERSASARRVRESSARSETSIKSSSVKSENSVDSASAKTEKSVVDVQEAKKSVSSGSKAASVKSETRKSVSVKSTATAANNLNKVEKKQVSSGTRTVQANGSVKKQVNSKARAASKITETTKPSPDVCEENTKDVPNEVITDKEETNDTNEAAAEETETNTIDDSSESATQVIKKFENKISEVSEKSSQSKTSSIVRRSQSMKVKSSESRESSSSVTAVRKQSRTSQKQSVGSSSVKTVSSGLGSRTKSITGGGQAVVKKQETDMDMNNSR